MGKHLTKADRIKLEALLKAGHGKKEIADMLHVHRRPFLEEQDLYQLSVLLYLCLLAF